MTGARLLAKPGTAAGDILGPVARRRDAIDAPASRGIVLAAIRSVPERLLERPST